MEECQAALTVMQRQDYIPKSIEQASGDKRIRINIQNLFLFEVPQTILMRDKESLLASLCQTEPSVIPDSDGSFCFHRDWWLFRYILNFN
jgi:hypothetical protein